MPPRAMAALQKAAKDKQSKLGDKKTQIKKTKNDDFERLLLQTTLEMQSRMRHSLLPAFNANQWPMEHCNELQNYPSCVVAVPRPVYIDRKHCERIDICHRRTLARSSYLKRLHIFKTRYHTSMQNSRKLRSMEKEHIYPTTLFNFAGHLERDPDKFFHGCYDYYYSGGNLCALPDGHVVHVDGADLHKLNISHFPAEQDCTSTTLCHDFAYTLATGDEIFEVQPLNSFREDRPNCFAMRQRNSIIVRSVQSDGRTKALTQFKTKGTPFIGLAQSPHERNIFLVNTMKQHVRWYDLSYSTPTLCKLYELGESDAAISWNTVRAWREQTFVYANEQNIFLMDLRTSPEQWLKSKCGFPKEKFICEYISALAVSAYKNLLYVGTNHKLHCLDVRRLDVDFEQPYGAICRWTHQLEYAPTIVQSYRDANTEFIALSSAVAGDLRICELTRARNVEKRTLSAELSTPKYLYKSSCLPYQPPTLVEAYESARLAGKCLQPDADLKNRIRCCTTGMSFLTDTHEPQKVLLLTSNSNGDVFSHAISERSSQEFEPRTNAQSDDIMCRYAEQICELMQPDLNYSDVLDMKAMRKVFRCRALNAVNTDEQTEDKIGLNADAVDVKVPVPKRRFLGRWQKSMQTLHSYKDALVQDLLAIWDIDYEEEKDIKLAQLQNEKQADPKSTVTAWLENTTVAQPMITVPMQNLSELLAPKLLDNSLSAMTVDDTEGTKPSQAFDFTQSFEDVPMCSTQLVDEAIAQLDASALDMQINTSLNSTKTKIKYAKKKTKYVKGF